MAHSSGAKRGRMEVFGTSCVVSHNKRRATHVDVSVVASLVLIGASMKSLCAARMRTGTQPRGVERRAVVRVTFAQGSSRTIARLFVQFPTRSSSRRLAWFDVTARKHPLVGAFVLHHQHATVRIEGGDECPTTRLHMCVSNRLRVLGIIFFESVDVATHVRLECTNPNFSSPT